MNARDKAAAALHPVPPDAAEALKTGRPPARVADDGKVGGQSQGGEAGTRNDPGAGAEAAVPGDAAGSGKVGG